MSTPPTMIHDGVEPLQTRRALVRSAPSGLQRFKQSWASAMLLKGSVGLGQVTALFTLLILAHFLSSPLAPRHKQASPSEFCPRPELFIAWMGVQIVRLTVCWSVSFWVLMRRWRASTVRTYLVEPGPGLGPVDDESLAGSRPTTPIVERPASPHHHTPTPSLSFSTSSPSLSAYPPTPRLSPSLSSSSSMTLVRMSMISSSSRSTPPTEYTSTMGSSLTLSQWHDNYQGKSEEIFAESVEEGMTAVWREACRIEIDQVMRHEEEVPEPTMEIVVQPSDEHPASVTDISPQPSPRSIAKWLDRHASWLSQALGYFSIILFILGNILLFYPPPSSTRHTCYDASPLLWWGVMVVTGVGWVLFAQVFVIVGVIGICGQAVTGALRRNGLIPYPPHSVSTISPLPSSTLSPQELVALQIVCYLPDPAPYSKQMDQTRLPYPPIHLEPHQTTCAICQEPYLPPTERNRVMLEVERLRLLGCGHVFHLSCIDQWLSTGTGECPFCKRSVRLPPVSPVGTAGV